MDLRVFGLKIKIKNPPKSQDRKKIKETPIPQGFLVTSSPLRPRGKSCHTRGKREREELVIGACERAVTVCKPVWKHYKLHSLLDPCEPALRKSHISFFWLEGKSLQRERKSEVSKPQSQRLASAHAQ